MLINNKGIVLEGPTFCVGWIKDEVVYVPDLDLGILDSITRQYLLKFGEENKIQTTVSRVTIDELYKVDTVFVMSAAKHGVFVSKIDNSDPVAIIEGDVSSMEGDGDLIFDAGSSYDQYWGKEGLNYVWTHVRMETSGSVLMEIKEGGEFNFKPMD